MRISQLKPSISELSEKDALVLIKKRRAKRRDFSVKKRERKKDTKRKKILTRGKKFNRLVSSLSTQDMKKLLTELEKGND